MTASGGDNGEGVIFSFNPPPPSPTPTPTATPANFETLYSFACASATGKEPHGRLTLDPNLTTLYGRTRKGGDHDLGVVFKFDTSDNTYSELHDFAGGHDDGATSDHGYVVQSGDHLYGTTANGGDNDGRSSKSKPMDHRSTCFISLVKLITMARIPTDRFSWSATNFTARPPTAATMTWARSS